MRSLLALAASATMAVGALTEEADAQVRVISINPDGTIAAADKDSTLDLGHNSLNVWRSFRAEDCLHVAEEPSPRNADEQFYAALRDELRQIPLGDRLFSDLEDSNIGMCVGDIQHDGNTNLYYNDRYEITVIPTDLPNIREDLRRGYQIMGTLHEMRHGWQDHLGLTLPHTALDQQGYMAQTYAMEADASAFMVAASWQLKTLQNDPDAWDYIQEDRYYRPIAEAFEQGLVDAGYDTASGEQPNAEQMRAAMQVAYQAWFDDTPLPQIYRDRAGDNLLTLPVMKITADEQRDNLRQRFETVQRGATATDPDRADSYFGDQQAALAVSEALRRAPVAAVTTTTTPERQP